MAQGREFVHPELAKRATHIVIIEGKGYDKLKYQLPVDMLYPGTLNYLDWSNLNSLQDNESLFVNPIDYSSFLVDHANQDRKSTRLNSSHSQQSRMPSSA